MDNDLVKEITCFLSFSLVRVSETSVSDLPLNSLGLFSSASNNDHFFDAAFDVNGNAPNLDNPLDTQEYEPVTRTIRCRFCRLEVLMAQLMFVQKCIIIRFNSTKLGVSDIPNKVISDQSSFSLMLWK